MRYTIVPIETRAAAAASAANLKQVGVNLDILPLAGEGWAVFAGNNLASLYLAGVVDGMTLAALNGVTVEESAAAAEVATATRQ